MQVTELKKEDLRCSYQIRISSAALSGHVDQELQRIGKTYKMKGFRPGKVPLSVLRTNLGQAVMADALQRAVNDSTQKVMQEKGLRPAGQPAITVDEFKEGQDLVFTMELETLPKFEVVDLKTISLTKPVAKASEDEVQKILQSLAEQNETSEIVHRAARAGDIIVIDFDGKTVDGTTFPGMKLENFDLKLGQGRMIPGFEEPLIGATAGDARDVRVTFPADYGMPGLAGKEAVFSVTVHSVKETSPAAIDNDLAQKNGFADLEALKKAIQDRAQREYDGLSRMKVKRSLLDALDAAHGFPLPAGMLEQEHQAIIRQIEAERHAEAHRTDPNHSHDHDDDHDHTHHSHISADEREELKTIAQRRVRLGLVLAEIGNANGITVSDADVNRALMLEAQKYPGQEKQVIDFYRKNRQALESLRAPLFEDKIVNFILEKASVTEKTVSIDELTAEDDEDTPKPAADSSAGKKTKTTSKKTAGKKESAD